MVLHADGAAVLVASAPWRSSTTAWTSCRRFAGAPPGLQTAEHALLARADVVFTGGQSLYLAKRQFTERPRVSEQRRRRALCRGARSHAADPGDQEAHSAAANRFLRRARRAARSRSARGRGGAARVAFRVDRTGRQDRSGDRCRSAEHPLPRTEVVRRPARLHRRVGRRVAAVRAQRGDPVHQPDEDAGVPGRRQAGRVHVDRGRRASVRRARARPDRRHRTTSSSALRQALCADRQNGCRAPTRSWPAMSWDATWMRMQERVACRDRRAPAAEPRRP